MADVMEGRWQGEFIDAYGYRANLELELETSGSDIRGRMQMQLRTDEDPVLITGKVEGSVTTKGGEVVMYLDGVDEKFENSVHLRDGGTHAHQAMFGLVTTTGKSGFGGGVWIVWRFDQPSQPKTPEG